MSKSETVPASTPREYAKQLIRHDVEWAQKHGQTEKAGCHHIVMGSPGMAGAGKWVDVRGHQVIVSKWNGEVCDIRFRLEALYREIVAEIQAAKIGVEQPALFDPSSASA